MENQFIYKPKYYQDNYQNINSVIEKFKKCKDSDYKYLFLQKIYLNTTDKVNWEDYKVYIRDTCYYLKFEVFHDNEWFQEIVMNLNTKFTKQNIDQEIHDRLEYLELKDKKYFLSPILKLKSLCIYAIIIINEKKDEIERMIHQNNRKLIFFSDITNMNNPNEYYNIIKNIKNTPFNKSLINLKSPLRINGISPINYTDNDNDNEELYIYLYKLIDNISNYF